MLDKIARIACDYKKKNFELNTEREYQRLRNSFSLYIRLDCLNQLYKVVRVVFLYCPLYANFA